LSWIPTLVDTNVLLDVFTEDRRWAHWSSAAITDAAAAGRLVVNPIIYAELAPRFPQIEELDAALAGYLRKPLPWAAAYLAGRAHARYRRAGGTRRSTLPDFFIGAHAAIEGMALLTRDAGRYDTYFPTVELISPA
jgi:predicted nucleic acid-binding protein